jgi:hypothetical protein
LIPVRAEFSMDEVTLEYYSSYYCWFSQQLYIRRYCVFIRISSEACAGRSARRYVRYIVTVSFTLAKNCVAARSEAYVVCLGPLAGWDCEL